MDFFSLKNAVFWLCMAVLPVQAQDKARLVALEQARTPTERLAFLKDAAILSTDLSTYKAFLPILEAKNDDKAVFMWHFQYWRHKGYFKWSDNPQTVLDNLSKIARERGLKAEMVVADFMVSISMFAHKDISEQQIYADYLNYFEQMKGFGWKAFENYTADILLHEMGRNFYQLGDYDTALECLSTAESLCVEGSLFQALILNLIEAIYAEMKDHQKAFLYAQKIYDIPFALNAAQDPKNWIPTFWRGLSSLDMAQYLLEMGRVKEAETYAARGYALYKSQEDITDPEKTIAAFDALQVLIKLKLKLGKIDEVEPLLKKVEALKPHIHLSDEINYFKPLRFYQNYTQYYEAKKDYTNAYRYMKLASEMQDSLNRRNDKRKLWQTEMRVKVDRYQAQIRATEADSVQQARLKNGAILALLLFGTIAFVIYRRIKQDNQTIGEQKALLERSLSEKDILLKEVHHRVKNNLQIISGLFEKQALQAADMTTKKLMKEGQDRVFSIALVHQNLYQSDTLSAVHIRSYLNMLTQNIVRSHHTEQRPIVLDLSADDLTIDIDMAIPLGLILNELMTNCYKYAFENREKGHINIRFWETNTGYGLRVADDGVGLPSGFDAAQSRSLGLNLVRGLVRQLSGSLDCQTGTQGTIFTVLCEK